MALMTFLSGYKDGFKELSETITAAVNVVLLSVVYLLGVGFVSITAKVKGKQFLDLKHRKASKTYYKELNLSKQPEEEYLRQF